MAILAAVGASTGPRFGAEYLPSSFVLRLGRREVFIGRDFRRRYSQVSPLLDCRTGVEAGYLELVILRKWLVVLSKAH